MKKKILSAILSLTMLFSVVASVGSITASAATLNVGVSLPTPSKMPTITPPANTHPRVMFTEASLETIKSFWSDDENTAAVTKFNELVASSLNTSQSISKATSDNDYQRAYLNVIQAKAFDYALNGTVANGDAAVAGMINFLNKVSYNSSESDICREAGYAVYIAAEVYDWCYDRLDDSEKSTIIEKTENIIKSYFETGYPATDQSDITGHAGEYQLFRDLLSFGIAVYDEKPTVYNHVMSRIEYEMAPARKWFYESGAPYQGDMYGSVRYLGEIYAEMLVNRMTDGSGSVFTDATHDGFKSVPRHWLYMHRPDGRLFTRGDDDSLAAGLSGYNTYHFVANFFAGNLFSDGYVKGESFRRTPDFGSDKYNNKDGLNAVTWLIMNDPDVNTQKTNRSSLPENIYFESPAGEIIAKTKWNYLVRGSDGQGHVDNDAVSAYMRIGEYYGGNHDDLDSGSFQLYYKGILASGSGFYDDYSSDHNQNYRKRTISHNALTISGDDDASFAERVAFFGGIGSGSNDGGQKITDPEISDLATWQSASGRYKRATVIDHYVSDTFSYIKGDLTPAYASSKLDSSVPVVRNMAFIETDDENVPAFMIIYDKLKGKSSSNVPQFNLHTQTQPSISGNTTTVVTDGGKMTVKTLLPESASISAVGGSGKQFYVNGKNYAPSTTSSADESGWGRIEIKPTNASTTTEFLNVFAVSDAGYTGAISAETITGSNVTGAKVLNQVVLFSQNAGRVAGTSTFTIAGSDTGLNVKILGINSGYWMVKKDGKLVAIPQSVMENDGNGATLSFTGDAGSYELTYVGEALEWEKIFEDTMEETVYDCATGTINNYYTMSDADYVYITNGQATGYTKSAASEFAVPSLKVSAQKNNTRYANLIVEESPLYGNPRNTKVRIEFDFATDKAKGFYIILVGEKDGEVVQTTAGDSGRFIFTSGGELNYETKTAAISTETWYKMAIDIDCASQTYDVYLNGELSSQGEALPRAYDKIYGVSFAARSFSSTSSNTYYRVQNYIDNLRYYTLKLDDAIPTYSVTLNANGGTIVSGDVTEYEEGGYVVLPTDVTKAGYVFGGWYENASFTGNAVIAIPTTATGDKTYYAKWLTVYSVTLNTDGGLINSGNVTEYEEGTATILPTDVTKAGYNFLGWYENASFTGNAVTTIPANATGNKTFYAKWEKLAFIADDVEWEKIFEEAMDEYPDQFDSGKGSVENYYEIGGYPSDTSWITTAAASFDKSAVSEYSGWSLRLGGPKNAVRYADMILEESPLYNNTKNTKVRVEFEFATDKDAGMYVILEGEKDGEHVRTTAGDSGRFIFTSNGCLNFETAIKGYTKNYMHKMVIDLDCETQKYDVYLDGSMVAYSQDFPMAMDKVYGVSFAAKGSSSASTLVFLENLRYYTEYKPEGLTIENVLASYSEGNFNFSALVTGYTKAAKATVLVGLFGAAGNLVDVVETPYATIKAANGNLTINAALKNPGANATVGVFAWDMETLVPLALSKTASIN